jgi:tRNA nucleotidyltransferase (CCA-adding enzyme)
MEIFMVGGAVRDALLGLPVQDRDWVVVGSRPEELVALGYLPVGKDFPVFLHPTTKEEYALARTERKTARGYHGFAVHAASDITLEQDLARRDLTINAIAACALIDWSTEQFSSHVDLTSANLIDPYGGQRDITAKLLRHVTDAFREDPVRILRVARFAARFADFSVAPETMQLMKDMVTEGEVDALVAERVWQELSRGLMEAKPSRMLEVLRECGALQKLLPEIDRLWGLPQRADYHPEIDTGVHLMMVLDMAAQLNAPLSVRFAGLMHGLGKGICERLRVPVECRELTDVVAMEHNNIHRSPEFGASALVSLLERCDAFRKPQRFANVLLACECDARGRLGLQEAAYPQRPRLLGVLAAAQAVVTQLIAEDAQAKGLSGKDIGESVHKARIQAVSQAGAA